MMYLAGEARYIKRRKARDDVPRRRSEVHQKEKSQRWCTSQVERDTSKGENPGKVSIKRIYGPTRSRAHQDNGPQDEFTDQREVERTKITARKTNLRANEKTSAQDNGPQDEFTGQREDERTKITARKANLRTNEKANAPR
ncbi:hypothetical protein [Rossellomorea vietnamensis]|uniref:hypothetical protein n=1 Tax=Rossellomorea vietnamensis TaxID=218284 RepID=UPI003CF36D0E